MDLEEGPTVAAAAVGLGSSPPTHDLESTPIGSPEDMVPSYFPPPSDDDHENDLGQDSKHEDDRDHDHGHDKDHDYQSTGPGVVLTDDLKSKIIKQVEYYFSDENLLTDKYMMSLIKKNKEGFVPISAIASFRKIKKLTRYYPSIVAALKESSLLVVSADGKKVKRLNPLPLTDVRDSKLFTVLVENLPEDHSVENIRKIFGEAGNIKSISIRDPHAMEESKKSIKAEILLTTRLHSLVEYETEEAAERAVALLNNDQDWRNGLRVKLLKRMGKYGQKRHAWRAPDSEKNIGGRASAQTGGEENNFSGHHDDTPDEEVAQLHSSLKLFTLFPTEAFNCLKPFLHMFLDVHFECLIGAFLKLLAPNLRLFLKISILSFHMHETLARIWGLSGLCSRVS
ncbi:la-related protein 6A [Carica papaya]|uniref:la-related protein 6A n=1 Tax=Carica papaya TaxID=3649 RepID=UPI000B8CE834|nr:la-related protein 6A [Carica papaya]